VCPPCAAPPTRWSVGPFPPRGFPPLPRYYGPIRLPTLPLPLRLPLGSAPAAPARGEGGISRVPSASRPCVPTAKAPVDARPLWPGRAAAPAFPAVAYGSASTVKGISGLVPFTPAAGGFRPTEFLSTLRPGRYRTGRKTRSQPRGGSPRSRWDFPRAERRAGHPLGSADLARRTQRPKLRPGLRITDSDWGCGIPGHGANSSPNRRSTASQVFRSSRPSLRTSRSLSTVRIRSSTTWPTLPLNLQATRVGYGRPLVVMGAMMTVRMC